MTPHDLPLRKDPKGGSPKTPLPIPVSQLPKSIEEREAYVWPTVDVPAHGGNGVWRTIAVSLMTFVVGMIVAWWTAFQMHGVTQKEMEDFVRQSQADQEKTALTRAEMQQYVKDYSPWVFDKQTIVNRMAAQDEKIGDLRGKIDLTAKYFEELRNGQPKR